MTSVLNVDTIAAKNGTSPVALTKQSAAKAYLSYLQNGSVVYTSLNTSSIVDNALGVATMSFVSNMNSNNYSVTGMASRKGNSLNYHVIMVDDGADPTASAYRVRVADVFGNDKAANFLNTSVDGDLA